MENFVITRQWVEENYHEEAEFTIPEGTTEIGVNAFYDCKSLKSIEIPNSVTEIGEHVFDGCWKLVIQCEEGSYAEAYAENHDIPVTYNKEQKKEKNSIEHGNN